MMRNKPFWRTPLLTLLLSTAGGVALADAQPSVVRERHDFDSKRLLKTQTQDAGNSSPGLSVLQPDRLSMQQSYSLTAVSGGGGSMSSGVYLNTISYQVSEPLMFSMDVGIHTPVHSNLPGQDPRAGAGNSSMILPRMGLEYRPNDRMSVHLDLFNGQDAWKAYGISPFSMHPLQGSRFSH